MISDVLFQAGTELDRYLADPTYESTYSGACREELTALRVLIGLAQRRLDSPEGYAAIELPQTALTER
jgi:hypothetical protein